MSAETSLIVNVLAVLFNQFGKLRIISRFVGCSFNAGNDMGFNTTHQMGFNPCLLTSFLAPLMVKPSGIGGSGEARRINGKVGFYGSQRACTLLNKGFEKWCQFRVFKIAECTIDNDGRFSNQFFSFSFFQVGSESSARTSCV